jgi:transposase InsO family protein
MLSILQKETGASTRQVSDAAGLSYKRILRWKTRARAGLPALGVPGPKKTEPLPLDQVRRDLEAMRHGLKRSRGSVELQKRYQPVLSRRDMAGLIQAERTKRNELRRQLCKKVSWKEPNLAWAIDSTERGTDRKGKKLIVHAVQDLCSRYRFAPLVALESKGTQVAVHLDRLFRAHGAPLFLKRDNGSPLNHEAVDAVLAKHGVIPLNSPAHYPGYNGAIEKGIREMKEALGECLPQARSWQPVAIRPYIMALHHALNCRRRRSLQGQTACEAYGHQPRRRYRQHDRLATFEWIRIHAIDRVRQLEKIDRRSLNAAWRHAAEAWLRCQGLITVSINHKVLPNLPIKYAYN